VFVSSFAPGIIPGPRVSSAPTEEAGRAVNAHPASSVGKSTATVQDAVDSFPIGVDHSDLVILYRIGSESQPNTTLSTVSAKPPVAFWYQSGIPGRSRNRMV